jgi:hypothetical protein
MKFEDVKVGKRFKVGDWYFTRIDNIMETCCKVKYNAIRKDGKKVRFKNDDEVERVK